MKTIVVLYLLSSSIFLFGQNVLSTSNLPIVVLSTNGLTIPDEPKISATMKIIDNGQGQRNSIHDTQYNYNGFIGIELRGNSSLSFDQKQYTIETRDSEGNNLNVSLLDMPKENDWVLHAPYNDISLLRNVIAYHLWSEMGHWGPRTRIVELILNGEYQGVYVLTETIKRDKNRLDIATLNPSDTTGIELSGGYIMKIDASNSDDDLTFRSKVRGLGTGFNKSVVWLYHYPDPKDIHSKQLEYIRNYIDTVELLIQSDKYDDPDNGYSKYINTLSFVDYFIHTELSLNPDGFKRSAYFYKKKLAKDGTKGKLKVGPVWDYNLAFGNCNFCKGNQINAWVHEGCKTLPVPAMWKRLFENPDFMNAVKSRYTALRENILSDSYIHNFIDNNAIILDEAQSRHFIKWDDLLKNENSSSGGPWDKLWFSAYRVSSYAEEINILKSWFSSRFNFLDFYLYDTSNIVSCPDNQNRIESFTLFQNFPNPFNPATLITFHLLKPGLTTLKIYNILGKEITTLTNEQKNSGFHEISWDAANFTSGIYLAVLQVDDCITSKKILLQK